MGQSNQSRVKVKGTRWGTRSRAALAAACWGLENLEGRALLSTYGVTTNADGFNSDGTPLAGSLRAAIVAANANGGANTINFNLPVGSTVITLAAALPALTDATVIDATGQAGYAAGAPAVCLDGSNLNLVVDSTTGQVDAIPGLELSAAGAGVRGLAIDGFRGGAILLDGGAAGGHDTVQADVLGYVPGGFGAADGVHNAYGVVVATDGNLIGGTNLSDAADRNVISGNDDSGVLLAGSGNTVSGNYLGTDATGLVAAGNGGAGVTVDGTSAAPANNSITFNLIAGNNGDGVDFLHSTAAGNALQGNLIGTDASGALRLSNQGNGVYLLDSSGVTVGGATAPLRNVISGNGADGIRLAGSSGNTVLGNYVGLDSTGELTVDANQQYLSNDGNGIVLVGASSNNVIGGTAAGWRNVVAGSGGDGVRFLAADGSDDSQGPAGTPTNNTVAGNYLGTDATGTLAQDANGGAFGNGGSGIAFVLDPSALTGNVVRANLISNNTQFGIQLGASGVTVQGNLIGTRADGKTALPNGSDGVFIDGNHNTIGGTAAGQGNVIAYGGTAHSANGNAVTVDNNGAGTAFFANTVRGNSIFSNAGIGIDLNDDGVTPNGGMSAASANDGQNYPVITSLTNNGTALGINGTVSGPASSVLTLDFYASTAANPALDYRQGQTYLGSVTVTTDASGRATFSASFTNVPAAANVVNATATDAAGNTSELGASAAIPAPVLAPTIIATTVQLSSNVNPAASGQSVTFTARVVPAGGSGVPTGCVVFMDGTTVLGTVPVSGGIAKLTTSTLGIGGHAITAYYNGDANFSASASAPIAQTVNAAAASVSGHVYNDATGDGMSADDSLMGGVSVSLYRDANNNGVLDAGDGPAVAKVVTGSGGAYSFTNLAPGKYFVAQTTPAGYVQTAPTAGTYYTAAVTSGSAVTNDNFDNFKVCNCSGDLSKVVYTVIDPGTGTHTYTDLRGHVQQGDTVTVTITVKPGQTDTFSLVSYTAPASSFNASQASQQKVYDYQTNTYGPGTYTLSVKVPPCYFQVDFVCGQVIQTFGPSGSNIFYSAEGRLFSADNGGTHAPTNIQALRTPGGVLS